MAPKLPPCRPCAMDTTPAMAAFQREGYRQMSPAQKLRCISQLNLAVQQMALSRIRYRYPQASEREQRLRLASLWLDREQMIRVFGWDPKREGY